MKKFFKVILTIGLFAAATQVFAQNAELTFNSNTLNESQVTLYRGGTPPTGSSTEPIKGETSSILDWVFQQIFDAFIMYNLYCVSFDYYPYRDGKYLKFYRINYPEDYHYINDNAPYYSSSDRYLDINNFPAGKFYRFEADSSVVSFPMQLVIGNETRFEGYIYKCFGPLFENTLYSKNLSGEEAGNGVTGNLKLGAQFTIIHSNYFDWSWHMQWSLWYGHAKSNGLNVGSIIRCYPVKPVIIEYRANFQVPCDKYHSNDAFIFESHLEAGAMIAGPLEVYAAWKYVYDDSERNGVSAHGAAAGLKVHF